ncbi:biotin transport system ATP-binding protein [Rhodobacter sp. JA431]|uniref:energy-coupling factor ABC transporter ATP-binding protein n=1 Tax=Rhodobacter sp. JA431 TaxID=570013 RepID=UPI000BCC02E1|nr:ABC transporter ATP-binding protein [Rhodobacter sp. JA431]SOC16095.1 biotin transport system ATP-binding protein [Rhodobacter sp. JA431]
MTHGIDIQSISLTREGAEVFRDFSLQLRERRIGIVGRNGAGKSSLIRLISGLVAPQSGTVTVEGVDVFKDRAGALDTVGLLFQNPDHQIIFPAVIEEIAFGLEQQGLSRAEARARARSVLAHHGRADWEDRLSHALSQGQRQLLCLMAVLAMEPRWILFDEPFASLDMPTGLAIEARIKALKQNVVIVTHDPSRVEGFDRILWLEAGKIAADGSPDEVLPRYRAAMEELARSMAC